LLFYKMLASTMQFSNNNPVAPRTRRITRRPWACPGTKTKQPTRPRTRTPPRGGTGPGTALLPQDPTVCQRPEPHPDAPRSSRQTGVLGTPRDGAFRP
jgi:hypothetical protein